MWLGILSLSHKLNFDPCYIPSPPTSISSSHFPPPTHKLCLTSSSSLENYHTPPFLRFLLLSHQVVKMPYYSHKLNILCCTKLTNELLPFWGFYGNTTKHTHKKMWLLMPFDISCFLSLPPYLSKLFKVFSKILLHTV